MKKLGLEILEARTTPAVSTWQPVGTSIDGLDPANWSDNQIPVNGNSIVIPAGTNHCVLHVNQINNLTAGSNFTFVYHTMIHGKLNITGNITVIPQFGFTTFDESVVLDGDITFNFNQYPNPNPNPPYNPGATMTHLTLTPGTKLTSDITITSSQMFLGGNNEIKDLGTAQINVIAMNVYNVGNLVSTADWRITQSYIGEGDFTVNTGYINGSGAQFNIHNGSKIKATGSKSINNAYLNTYSILGAHFAFSGTGGSIEATNGLHVSGSLSALVEDMAINVSGDAYFAVGSWIDIGNDDDNTLTFNGTLHLDQTNISVKINHVDGDCSLINANKMIFHGASTVTALESGRRPRLEVGDEPVYYMFLNSTQAMEGNFGDSATDLIYSQTNHNGLLGVPFLPEEAEDEGAGGDN